LFGLRMHNSGQMEIAGGRDESGGVEHPGFAVTCWVGCGVGGWQVFLRF
jgi:hypothetical protein